jgi:hypothetical protein
MVGFSTRAGGTFSKEIQLSVRSPYRGCSGVMVPCLRMVFEFGLFWIDGSTERFVKIDELETPIDHLM